jgi:hypothetical protein
MNINSSTASASVGYRKEDINDSNKGASDDGQYSGGSLATNRVNGNRVHSNRLDTNRVDMEDATKARQAGIHRPSNDADLYEREVWAMVMSGCC